MGNAEVSKTWVSFTPIGSRYPWGDRYHRTTIASQIMVSRRHRGGHGYGLISGIMAMDVGR
ncbi:MAG: hypothetical protein O2890_06320 [Cyanobacteria bacterium]|nr:hypothetical protein [Cyanobacteriota bacterium]MDA0866021.1 hypothetical protein [Cyanobacteriota bacterium]